MIDAQDTLHATLPHRWDAETPTASGADGAKRAFDVAVAVIVLMMLLPLILITAALVLVLQGRPILYRQQRIGRGGKTFPCLKFRSMVNDSDEALRRHLETDLHAKREWEANHKLAKDPRVTRLGAAMRKSSLDELPQLINVVRGDMSLVGPRPITPAEEKRYGAHINDYHSVRPGITGLWQVSGRSNVTYERRVALDRAYVMHRSFGRDLTILLRTIPAVIQSRGSC